MYSIEFSQNMSKIYSTPYSILAVKKYYQVKKNYKDFL